MVDYAIATWYDFDGGELGFMRYMWHTKKYVTRDAKILASNAGAVKLKISFIGDDTDKYFHRHKSRWYAA